MDAGTAAQQEPWCRAWPARPRRRPSTAHRAMLIEGSIRVRRRTPGPAIPEVHMARAGRHPERSPEGGSPARPERSEVGAEPRPGQRKGFRQSLRACRIAPRGRFLLAGDGAVLDGPHADDPAAIRV
jgi:hypothetical protein